MLFCSVAQTKTVTAPGAREERLPTEKLPAERLPVEKLPAERLPMEKLPAERPPAEKRRGELVVREALESWRTICTWVVGMTTAACSTT